MYDFVPIFETAADNSLRILKRRLAWLLGEWASTDGEHVPTENGHGNAPPPAAACVKMDLLWQILTHLLTERGDATDKAVQLTATASIKACVDVSVKTAFGHVRAHRQLWEVDIDYFVPHLQPVAQGM
jgi:hypothetical protein